MDLFGMGMAEILLILIVALIIWGPRRIPEIARTLGRTLRALRKASADLTSTVAKELSLEEKDLQSQSRANSGNKTKESSDRGTVESSNPEKTSPRD